MHNADAFRTAFASYPRSDRRLFRNLIRKYRDALTVLNDLTHDRDVTREAASLAYSDAEFTDAGLSETAMFCDSVDYCNATAELASLEIRIDGAYHRERTAMVEFVNLCIGHGLDADNLIDAHVT